jgi:hypothetical protein
MTITNNWEQKLTQLQNFNPTQSELDANLAIIIDKSNQLERLFGIVNPNLTYETNPITTEFNKLYIQALDLVNEYNSNRYGYYANIDEAKKIADKCLPICRKAIGLYSRFILLVGDKQRVDNYESSMSNIRVFVSNQEINNKNRLLIGINLD